MRATAEPPVRRQPGPRANVETASARSVGQRRPGAKPGTRPRVNADARSSWVVFAAKRPAHRVPGAFRMYKRHGDAALLVLRS